MNGRTVWSALGALGLGITIAAAPGDAWAQNKKKDKPAAAAPAEAATAKKDISLDLSGVSWSQSPKQVAEAIDKIIDEDYKEEYKKTSPGVKMKALDAKVSEEKSAFRRSRIDFGKTPVALDSGPLKGEFTYNNKESLLTWERKSQKIYFFFIQDKLWKVIFEHKLGEKEPMGKDFADATSKLTTKYGIAGRSQAADESKGRQFAETDWKDAKSHLRAIDRSSTLGLAFEDHTTVANLSTLRANKPAATNEIDPAVAAVTRAPDAPPGPPTPPPKDEKKPAAPAPKK